MSVAPVPASEREELIPAGRAVLLPVEAGGAGGIALRRWGLLLADGCALLGAAVAAAALAGGSSGAAAIAAITPVWLLLFAGHGLYAAGNTRLWHLTADEVPRIFYASVIALAGGLAVLSATGVEDVDAASGILIWAVAFSMAVTARAAVRFVWRHATPPERGLLVGSGAAAEAVVRKLTLETGHHFQAVRRVDAGAADHDVCATVAHAVETEGIDRVVLAVPTLDDRMVAEVNAICRGAGSRLTVVSPSQTLTSPSVRYSQVAELPILDFDHRPQVHAAACKRVFDIVVSGTALVLSAPLFALVALMIRAGGRGPVFFRQIRAGKDMKPFTMLKFRTMRVGAGGRVADEGDTDGQLHPLVPKPLDDPRITRIGRLLRISSLDELPQLFNVLKGEMSLVGPRPEEYRLVVNWPEEARERLRVKPGLTGPMQIHGRGALTFEERLAIEMHYLDHHSLGRDLAILLKTVSVVFRRGGAY